MKKINKVAIEAALKAGRYVKANIGKIKTVGYKGDINVVTNVDKKAESIIVETIRKSFPTHNFLAEENTYPQSSDNHTWIIDPLDGTTNFLHGFPVFCVSIAFSCGGKIKTGVVYDPTRDELFHAERGRGAFLNEKKIHVSGIKKLKKAMLATGFAYNLKNAKNTNIRSFTRFIKATQAVRRAGSAAIDLCYVAAGRFDGFWELNLNPWDTAAGILMVTEAGGRVSKLDGSAYTVYDKELLASNSKIHSKMKNILTKQ